MSYFLPKTEQQLESKNVTSKITAANEVKEKRALYVYTTVFRRQKSPKNG